MRRYLPVLMVIILAIQTAPVARILGRQVPPAAAAVLPGPTHYPPGTESPPGLAPRAPRPIASPTPPPPAALAAASAGAAATPAPSSIVGAPAIANPILHVPSQYPTISLALQAATAGQTVQVAAGTYFEHGLTVPAGVALVGAGSGSSIIDGGAAPTTTIVNLDSGASLSGFTIRDSGSDYWDAAVWLLGGATVTNNAIEHNAMGIARYCFTTPCSDTSTMSGNLIAHNVNAGILVNGAGAVVTNNTIVDTSQAVTFVANGAAGGINQNIISSAGMGIAAPATVSINQNLLFETSQPYGAGTTPGGSDLQADPLFVDPAQDNYALFAGSPAISTSRNPPVTLGAFPFTPTGTAPAQVTVSQSAQGLSLSWPGNGAAGYYVYSNAPGGGSFNQPIDNGSATSALLPLPPAGSYTVGVSSYDAQHRESALTTATANVAGVILSPTTAAIGQVVTVTVIGYAANESVSLTISGGSCPNGTSHSLTAGSTNSAGLLATSFVLPTLCTTAPRPDSSANAGTTVSVTAAGATSGLTTVAPLAVPGTAVTAYPNGPSVELSGSGFRAGEAVAFAFKPTQGSSSIASVTVTADSTGHVFGTAPLPSSLTHGTYSVAATGLSSGFTATMPGLAPSWQWQHPLPQGNPLRSVSCPTSTNCFAVGDLGSLMVTSNGGSSWTNLTSSLYGSLTAVSCPSSTSCFASGSNGVLATNDGGATWINQTPGTTDYLSGISCPSSTTCVAIGQDFSTGNVLSLSTTNGGASWTSQAVGDNNLYLAALSCPSATNCFAVGFDNSTGSAAILATTNGGTSWTSQTGGASNQFLYAVDCPSAASCFAVGADGSTGNQLILATTNGGASWTSQPAGGLGGLFGIACASGTTCFAVGYGGNGGAVLATTNGGAAWSVLAPGTRNFLWGISCASSAACLAVGDGDTIVTTANGGSNWTRRIAGTEVSFSGISCPTSVICFATDYDNSTANGAILATTNGGASWTSQSIGVPTTLSGISCPSTSTCFVAGAGGTILETSNGGASWTSQSTGVTAALSSVSCPSATTCFAVGAGGVILATSSGGTSWSSQPTGVTFNLAGISCPSTTVCFAVGAGGAILATTNGGASWVGQNTSATTTLSGISCPSVTSCVAIGADIFSGAGAILATHTGGASWISPAASYYSPNTYLASLSCPTTTTCYAVGYFGALSVTTDGGTSWSYPQSGTSNFLTGISCPSAAVCTAVGSAGTILSDRPLTVPAAASVNVTDLNGSGFAVTFTTALPTSATLLYGTSAGALTSTAFDDRDGSGPAATQSTVHRFTLSGLTAGTTYYFEPSVLGVPQPNTGGGPYSQAVPTVGTLPSHAATGSVSRHDGSVPAPATVLLTGYWTNSDGSRSLPVSVFNTTAGSQNLNYTIAASPLNQAGTAYFALTVGSSVFHVSGAGDDGGTLGSGGPVTAVLATPTTVMPSFSLAPFVTFTFHLQAGWNLISLPLTPPSPLDAQTVLTTLLAQTHGGYAEIDSYSSGQFTPSMFADPGGGLPLGGTNFTLQVGHGYALYTDTTGTLAVTGSPAPAQTVTLATGWNLVGFPDAAANPVQAYSFLTGLLGQTHGGYAEIDAYTTGQFTPSAFADPGGGLPLGGTNFTVQPGQGYAVYTDTGTTQTL